MIRRAFRSWGDFMATIFGTVLVAMFVTAVTSPLWLWLLFR